MIGTTRLAAICMAALLVSGTAFGQALKSVNVGMQPIVNGPIYIAIKEKYFEQMGLNLNLVKFTSGPAQFAAIAGGQVDLAWGGMGAFLLAKANGQNLNFFSVFMDYNPLEGIVVPGASRVKNLKDLAGTKIALVQGSDAHYGMLKALRRAGMDKNALQILGMAPPQQVAAFESKDVDAIFSWEPFLTPLTQKGARVIFRNNELNPGPAFLGWAGKREWLAANQDTVVKILKGWDMGLKKMRENPQLAIRYSMEWAGMNEAQAQAIQKQLIYFDATAALDPAQAPYWAKGSKLNLLLHDFLAFGKEYNLVKGDADVDNYVMTGFMQAVKAAR
ncbi:MAG: NrtA/SsuA/CpmA family ABC transporter substrate-binding protein [Betaproteobacteria bacterium]